MHFAPLQLLCICTYSGVWCVQFRGTTRESDKSFPNLSAPEGVFTLQSLFMSQLQVSVSFVR